MTHALVEFMLATGLRLNEARALMVSDLDLQNCMVTVRSETSKFRKGRTVYFHPDVAAHLDRYLRSREDNWNADTRKAFLWVNRSGEPFTIDAFGKVFLRLKARSGIDNFPAHVCRHTWATSFMQVPNASLLAQASGWLGKVGNFGALLPCRATTGPQCNPQPARAFECRKPDPVKLPFRAAFH